MQQPIRLFCGWDRREAVGLHVFVQSILERASIPVSITPLTAAYMPASDRNEGTNAFTFARFAVPRLCNYAGMAIFLDGSDMLCRADIAELWALADPKYAIQVVKHDYKTKHPRKYVGTSMAAPNIDYPRKNWASAFICNASDFRWKHASNTLDTLQLKFLPDHAIGDLPAEWNWLVDEYGPNDDAKLLHWTAGIPGFPEYQHEAHADEWFAMRDRAMGATG